MALEYTFSMIKPDATKRNIIGQIISKLEERGLKVVAQKMLKLSEQQAKEFYAEHLHRPFFGSLVENITAGPVVVQVLEGENAILANREIMGATDPLAASEGTIRKTFGLSIDHNTIHGSDSPDSAKREIAFFFDNSDLVS